MLRIGFIDYLNAIPLYGAFRSCAFESEDTLTYGVPSTLNTLLREGALDVSQVSSVEHSTAGYVFFPDIGIAARTRILSVNLYIKSPVASLNGKRIGLTSHSATSIALLKVLCHHMWHVEPHFETLDRSRSLSSYEGILLIGDEALENINLPTFQTIDLAEAWTQATGLPFVFALFAVRQKVWEEQQGQVALFQKRLNAALNWAENNTHEILKLASARTHLPLSLLQTYYELCTYRLGKQDFEGLHLFNKLRHDVP